MALFNDRQSLGLDMGQATIKGVVLRHDGRTVQLVESRKLDCRAEGLLSEDEVSHELGRWCREAGWDKIDATAAIPQYLASTQVSDFPPSSRGNLADMVKFETQHLAGLSGEGFIYDYAGMPPFGRSSPVLIGMCRESVIHERTQALAKAGIRIADLAISGPAMAAAYFHLHPEAVRSEAPQLLLDIGAESTTLVIVAGGDVLFTSSLMSGADIFLVGDRETVGGRRFGSVAAMDPNSSSTQAAVALEREIKTALDNWHSDEQAELPTHEFGQVSLCGGGAHIQGLDRYLGRAFGCSSRVFGVQIPGENSPDPTLVTAFGLALQGLGSSPIPLSMAPPKVKNLALRRRRFRWLGAAAVVLVALVILFEAISYRRLREDARRLTWQIDELKRCALLIPRLEENTRQIEFHQRMMLPFVAKGNRTQRYLRAIAKLERANEAMLQARKEDEGWVVYLADSDSFEVGKTGMVTHTEVGAGALNPFAPLAKDPKGTPELTAQIFTPVDDIKPLESMVVGLYTTADRNDKFRLVKPLVAALRAGNVRGEGASTRDTKDEDLFVDVDLMAATETAGREDVFLPWLEAIRQHRLGGYRRFILRLPFREPDVYTGKTQ